MGLDRIDDKYVARNPATAARRLGSEMIVVSALSSELFTLNETAAAIWEAADGMAPLRDIVEKKLCADFEVEPDTAYADALALVQDLAGRGILIISDEPISTRRGS